ncbi:transglycosylase SLT domain-containing protein [Altererythrobacter buctensis]|uniref:Transglycosylase SLT domain-containing protein n=2 Tax=Alteraurantiacibacter buctensis TaxID=1503981 RepID=A0A844YZC0_9SPHN|nr:transglycosylase SLT domain-containing protein [Alteraurantiacibacter buctensis]
MVFAKVLVGILGLALALTSPAQGRVVTSVVSDFTTETSLGDPHGEDATGFRLVEHGAWQRPQSADVQEPATTAGLQSQFDHHISQRDRASSNFRRATYLGHVRAAEARHALPAGLLDALVWTESRYNPTAVSKAGAAGLGQLMPGTARDLGVANRFDPVANVNGAARYLRQMLDKFGVVQLALAAYNAGPRAVERARGIPRNRETPTYVRSVVQRWRAAMEAE